MKTIAEIVSLELGVEDIDRLPLVISDPKDVVRVNANGGGRLTVRIGETRVLEIYANAHGFHFDTRGYMK